MKVSVLIVTRNRSKLLKRCLLSLLCQKSKPSEVIVVDNDSSDRTKQVVGKFKHLNTKYILEKRIGISFCRNTAIQVSKGEILAFIDDDCIADGEWIKRIIEVFENNRDTVGLLGRSDNYLPTNPAAVIEQCWFLYWYLGYYRSLKKSQLINNCGIVDFKNAAFKSKFIKKFRFSTDIISGDFSEEDVELGLRLENERQPGEVILYDPKLLVKHRNSDTIVKLLLRKFYKGVARGELLVNRRIPAIHRTLSPPMSQWLKLCYYEAQKISKISNKIVFLIFFLVYPLVGRIGRLWFIIKQKS